MFGPLRGGLGALLVIVAVIYFSGAGKWALERIKGLDSACFSSVTRLSPKFAGPVCGTLAKGVGAVDTFATAVSNKIEAFKNNILGDDGLSKLRNLASSLGGGVSGLTSSGDNLSRIFSAGPAAASGGSGQSFQQAIDMFAIGQGLLKNDGTAAQALPWLQQGAQQPQGFGLMSQLSLGNLYANGGAGIPANPQRAQYYLEQARGSIGVLSSSNSPQAKQVLGTLPGSPEKIQADIQRAIIQIRGQRL